MHTQDTNGSGRANEAARLVEAGKTELAVPLLEELAEQVRWTSRRTSFEAAVRWAQTTAPMLAHDHRADVIADWRGLSDAERRVVEMLADRCAGDALRG